MNNFKVILFDLGGVIVKLTGVPTMLDWLGNSISESEMWSRWLHSPSVRAFELGQIPPEAFANRMIEEMDLPVDPITFVAEFTSWPSGVYSGSVALLSQLRERYTVACLSNSNVLHWERLMTGMNLRPLFHHQFASHIHHVIKPDKDSFQLVVRELGVQPHEILFFDDNRINTDSAMEIGMTAITVNGIEPVKAALNRLEFTI